MAGYPVDNYNLSAAGTQGSVSNFLKKVIAPRIEEQLTQEKALKWFKMVQKEPQIAMPNNNYYITLRKSRHSGITSTTAGNKLGSGNAQYDQAVIPSKYVYGVFDILGPTMAATDSPEGSIVRALVEASDSLRQDFARDLNRIFWGASDGVVAITSGSGSGTTGTITLKNRMGLTTTDTTKYAIQPNRYLPIGRDILIGSSLATVTGQVGDTQITFKSTGTTTWTNGQSIVFADGDGAAADEPMGASGIVDDGTMTINSSTPASVSTFEGIVRSTNSYWQSNVFSNAGALTESNMETVYLQAKQYGDPTLIFMNYLLYKKYGDLLLSYKKSATTHEALTGGFTGLDFAAGGGDVTVVVDYDVPDSEVYFIDPTSISLGQLKPTHFIDQGSGNVLRRMDYDGWQAVLAWYGNMICKNVRSNAKMTAQATS